MLTFRLKPTPEQEAVMVEHCGHARYVWNLALEQANIYLPSFGQRPNYVERCRQLTEARAASDWLRSGPQVVQQQALRDFEQALKNWWGGTHRRPTWRKEREHEGFRITGRHALEIRQLNRKWSEVRIPKVGWVRLRRTRALGEWKSYRVKRDRAGDWWIHLSGIPDPIPAPGDGSIVGIDRGVRVTMALSTGEKMHMPTPSAKRKERHVRLQRDVNRRQPGSKRREAARVRLARHRRRDASRRKNFVEQSTTDIARRFDLIRIEDLPVAVFLRSARGTVDNPGTKVAAKRALNRLVGEQCWGALDKRLHDKARGRVEKVSPRNTSRRCHKCGHIDPKSRESQARFRCVECGHTANADVNAALNIAAGRAVTGRRDISKGRPDSSGAALSTKCQPQSAPCGPLESSPGSGGEDVNTSLDIIDSCPECHNGQPYA